MAPSSLRTFQGLPKDLKRYQEEDGSIVTRTNQPEPIMKDTILNSTHVASLFASVVFATFGNDQSASQAPAAGSQRVVQMEKTVVTAKRLAPELQLAAVADR